MGNLLSVLIGCVGAVEMFTLLHQITTRAELEYERMRLSEISESSPQEGAEIIQRIISSSQSDQKKGDTVTTVVPQIHFEEFERSNSVPESSAPFVDGLKYRPLVRDDGTGRRRAFKKRNSSGSIDSKLSREEELKMFTSLEEEEFKSMTQGDYVPISYTSEPVLKVRRHHKRHRKSPISDTHHESTGTLSSDVTEETLSEENEDEVTYPWGDINPEHHKGFRHQMEKSLSIGNLKEEDEKLASSVESNTDWRNNAEIAIKTAEREKSADVTVSSAEWKNPGDFEAVPGSFACVDESPEVPEVEDEAKVEEWLNHGRLRDSFSPSGTLTRSKRCLQMESMDVQDGDTTSEDTTDITSEEIVAEIVETSLDTNHIENSYSYLELTAEDKEEILLGASHKSPSPRGPRDISREFIQREAADEEEEAEEGEEAEEAEEAEDEELVLSGEEEIEDFDDIVNALKKNVAKEDIKFEDLLEDASLTSQKSDIFSVSPEREGEDGDKSGTDEEEYLTFPGKIHAAHDEFPLENMIPYSKVSGEEKPRCEILEQVKRENRRRRQMEGPDKYFAPRPSIIDFPTRLQMSNATLQDDMKVFPLKNVNDSQSFPTEIVPVREKSSDLKIEIKPGTRLDIKVEITPDTEADIVVTELPAAEDAKESKVDELTKFLNNERLSISPGRQSSERSYSSERSHSYERSNSNMRIADRDDPLMQLLKDRMFPY